MGYRYPSATVLVCLSLLGCATSQRPDFYSDHSVLLPQPGQTAAAAAPAAPPAVSAPVTMPARVAAATSAPPVDQDKAGRKPDDTDKVILDYEIVRYIGSDSSKWASAQQPQSYADFYTRAELRSDMNTTGVSQSADGEKALRDYSAEDRSWLQRLWASETDTVTTVANVEITDPGLKLAIPLFSSTHASGRDLGNTWTTTFASSNIQSPLFRIGPNTGITVHLAASVSSDLKSQGASLAISAITTAVGIAAPTSSLLTTLSKPDISNTANAIDTTISSLLSKDISEDIQLGRLADSWTQASELTLYGCAPFIRTEESAGVQSADAPKCAGRPDIDEGKDTPVGTWHLTLACPRLSAFDSRDICHNLGTLQVDSDGLLDLSTAANMAAARNIVSASASDAQILSFNLSSQVSIQSYVQAQTWYTTFIAKSGKTKPDYANFCGGEMTGMEASGLNRFDAALVLRAMIDQLPQLLADKSSYAAGQNGDVCVTLMTSSGVVFP